MALAATALGVAAVAQEPAVEPAQEGAQNALPTGWRWEFEPRALSRPLTERPFDRLTRFGAFTAAMLHGGRQRVRMVQTVGLELEGARALEFRVVAQAEDGAPLRAVQRSTMANPFARVIDFAVLTEDPDDVASIGLAVLDFDGRVAASASAAEAARAAGARVLPLPVIGQAYDFALPTLAGGQFTASEWRDKVLMIDAWATW